MKLIRYTSHLPKIILIIAFFFLQCNQSPKVDPDTLINKSISDLKQKYGQYNIYYHLASIDANSNSMLYIGYEIGSNTLLVYTIKNKIITDYHQTKFLHSQIDIEDIKGFTVKKIINTYGTPFSVIERFRDGKKVTYLYYKWKKYWDWKKCKSVPGYTYQIISVVNDQVKECYLYTFGSP